MQLGRTLGLAVGLVAGLVTFAPLAGAEQTTDEKATVAPQPTAQPHRGKKAVHRKTHRRPAIRESAASRSSHAQPEAATKTERGKKVVRQIGMASWYGGTRQRTASGERLDDLDLTAAHLTLPLQSKVRVTNLENGRSITVRVTDRGPHLKGRIIDLSQSAAEQLDMKRKGVARVQVEPVDSSSRARVAEFPRIAY